MHGWRWWGRGREALSADSRDLKQRYGRMEVRRDLRRHGVRRRRLQADWQGSSRALHGVVMLKNVQLRGSRVHHRHRSVTGHGLGRKLAFSGIWRAREKNDIKNSSLMNVCKLELLIFVGAVYLFMHRRAIQFTHKQ